MKFIDDTALQELAKMYKGQYGEYLKGLVWYLIRIYRMVIFNGIYYN
jgi:hypothetical protein